MGDGRPVPSGRLRRMMALGGLATGIGGRVLAEGRVTRMGRRVAFLDASLFDDSGVLLATASSSALLEG